MLEDTLGGTGNISSHHAEFVVTPVTSDWRCTRVSTEHGAPPASPPGVTARAPTSASTTAAFAPSGYAKGSADDIYWRLRRSVMLSHTGELPTEIRGPGRRGDARSSFLPAALARFVLVAAATRSRAIPMVASLMDGVLIRLEADRFWYVQSDGEFYGWLRAQATGFRRRSVPPRRVGLTGTGDPARLTFWPR